ncbi:MAG: Ppx/GppA phosphatase family protein, partial [Myxococcaceae bacterium]
LCIDIGGGSTEVASALGDTPNAMWSVGLGSVRMTELFGTSRSMSSKQLKLMRGYVSEALTEGLPARIAGAPRAAFGSSGTIGAVVAYAATEGSAHATGRQISQAVEDLV